MVIIRSDNYLPDSASLQKALGIRFREPALLEQALVLSSYVNENPGTAPTSNERLEFLGDAVLGLIIAEELYRRYPRYSEGEMTPLRSKLVCRTALGGIARSIALGDYIYLGRGEETSCGRRKTANLAGALEAVIAAVFLDQGLDVARQFILGLFHTEIDKLAERDIATDYKSRLQHLSQSRYKRTPVYYVTEATGDGHERLFTAEVRVDETVLGRGSGRNKKSAETEAARSALEKLRDNFTR
jgi:ribonuclease-3